MNQLYGITLQLKQGQHFQTSNVNNSFGKGHKGKNKINKNQPLNQFMANSTQ